MAGYPSLSYLKKFKAYKIRIAQSFVRDISTAPEDKAIVSAIINLAKSLGLQTIAEGVETVEKLAFLHKQGGNKMRDCLFSKPLPMEQFSVNANMDFALLVPYGCDASFKSIVYWLENCESVAKVQFKKAKNTGKKCQDIVVLTAGSNLQISLMPVGNDCVSIKKQTLFDEVLG